MLNSKFINSYLIEKDEEKFIIFYDYETKYFSSQKNISEEERQEIIKNIDDKFFNKNDELVQEPLIEFSEIIKMTQEISKRKDSDVCRRNKL